MTVSELVDKLEATYPKTDVVARMVGYVVLAKRSGGVDNLNISRASKYALKKLLRSHNIDPDAVSVSFTDF